MPNYNTPVENAQAAVKALRTTAAQLEARAAHFRAQVEALAHELDGKGDRTPDQVAAIMASHYFLPRWLEELDGVAHMHSGGNEAMHWRNARQALLAMTTGQDVD